MKRLLAFTLLFFLTGCGQTTLTANAPTITDQEESPSNQQTTQTDTQQEQPAVTEVMTTIPAVYYPVQDYASRVTLKKFGQEVHDRFCCFHVADDLEVSEAERTEEIPVYAFADGTVVNVKQASGYGGVMVLQHEIDGRKIQSLYGHIDLSQTRPKVGDQVRAGTIITYLGDHESAETDGERKHLHFGLYEGTTVKLPGYVAAQNQVSGWINPSVFLRDHQAVDPGKKLGAPTSWQRANLHSLSDIFRVSLLLPPGWKMEEVPSIQAINIYDPQAVGNSTLEQSQIFVRYFDASDFLTLSTVTIHNRYLRTFSGHDAVEYDIEKNAGVANFPSQPSWRNTRHTVTDIRNQAGRSRFYVFGQNPKTDKVTIEQILQSITLQP